jgi:hypothetical protein
VGTFVCHAICFFTSISRVLSGETALMQNMALFGTIVMKERELPYHLMGEFSLLL